MVKQNFMLINKVKYTTIVRHMLRNTCKLITCSKLAQCAWFMTHHTGLAVWCDNEPDNLLISGSCSLSWINVVSNILNKLKQLLLFLQPSNVTSPLAMTSPSYVASAPQAILPSLGRKQAEDDADPFENQGFSNHLHHDGLKLQQRQQPRPVDPRRRRTSMIAAPLMGGLELPPGLPLFARGRRFSVPNGPSAPETIPEIAQLDAEETMTNFPKVGPLFS